MIKYLKYENKKLPIRVSYYALKKLKEDLGRELSKDDDNTDYEGYECLLYYALEAGHKKIGKEMPYKKEEMEMMMDEVYFEFMEVIPSFFPKSVVDKAKKIEQEANKGKK